MADKVADMVADKVVDMEADKVDDMVAAKIKIKIDQHGVGHGGQQEGRQGGRHVQNQVHKS